ncbi:hypothetical protein E2C01_079125 [Portunus trituberculatus]|uniref:Uncharacterized protein n=1 Tax=Portunus trituberculatus TaxID=210409 RepID=A0A5B7ISG4_PORTR|nr:hypothetical protein [Portunus trituberculatus]
MRSLIPNTVSLLWYKLTNPTIRLSALKKRKKRKKKSHPPSHRLLQSHHAIRRKFWTTSLNKHATVSRSGASRPDMSSVILSKSKDPRHTHLSAGNGFMR